MPSGRDITAPNCVSRGTDENGIYPYGERKAQALDSKNTRCAIAEQILRSFMVGGGWPTGLEAGLVRFIIDCTSAFAFSFSLSERRLPCVDSHRIS